MVLPATDPELDASKKPVDVEIRFELSDNCIDWEISVLVPTPPAELLKDSDEPSTIEDVGVGITDSKLVAGSRLTLSEFCVEVAISPDDV